MKRHFEELAHYNRWANLRLYADAAALDDDALRRDVGVYFKSLFETLQHILKVDHAWAHLLDGGVLESMPPATIATDLAALREIRRTYDTRMIERMTAIDPAWLDAPMTFTSALGNWRGLTYRATRADFLAHLFNHQTHHRSQAHTALSLLGVEPAALDLLVKGMLGE